MTLGQRIKALRKERSMTQSALCGTYMTRNMLSQIENDQASPSLATVCYIAEQLQIPVGYLLDKEITPLVYRKAGLIELIRTAYAEGRWQDCIDHCKQLSDFDDELALLLSDCYLQEGIVAFRSGYLDTAKNLLDTALRFTACTRYPKSAIEEQAHTLLDIIGAAGKNQPLDPTLCASIHRADQQEEYLYNLLLVLMERGKHELASQLFDNIGLTNPLYRKHINACLAGSVYNYQRAVTLLREIIEEAINSADALFVLRIYNELEGCCKAMSDYEGAYRAAVAKAEIMENFHY